MVACAEQDKNMGLEAAITLPLQDQEIREGELVFFEGSASGGMPPYAYHWDFGKTMPPIQRKVTGQIVFNFEGAYKVLFTVKDSKGDESTDSVRIIVSPKS
jgi:PKD domain